jgi:hypothetical protein
LPARTAINTPKDQLESISFPSVARCARCGEDTLNIMVLKTPPERVATIRDGGGANSANLSSYMT